MKKSAKSKPAALEIQQIQHDAGQKDSMDGIMIFDSAVYSLNNIPNRPFRSRHYSLILVHHGQMTVKVNLTSYSLTEKTLLLIQPSAIREMNWNTEDVHFSSLLFLPDFLAASGLHARSFSQLSFLKNETITSLQLEAGQYTITNHTLELIRLILLQESLQNIHKQEMVRPVFQSAILQINQLFGKQPSVQTNNNIVHRFFDLLTHHYKEQREVSFYAEKLQIHEKYLSQVLKEQTGETARTYIIQMVILEAKVLLDVATLTVSQIAEDLRFSNQFHFSRFFKQYTSTTPTQYRNSRY